MPGYTIDRFANGTGTTTASASATVTAGHRFALMGGSARISVNASATVTCVLTTGTAVQTFIVTTPGAGTVHFVVADDGSVSADGGAEDDCYVCIGKNHVAKSGETLSLVITASTGGSAAAVVISGIDYTE